MMRNTSRPAILPASLVAWRWATLDGVVRIPSAFSMTFGVLPSITATQELVVPRSIPMTLAMVLNPLLCGRSGWPIRGALKSDPLIHTSPRRSETGCARRFPLAHIGGHHHAARQDCPCQPAFSATGEPG